MVAASSALVLHQAVAAVVYLVLPLVGRAYSVLPPLALLQHRLLVRACSVQLPLRTLLAPACLALRQARPAAEEACSELLQAPPAVEQACSGRLPAPPAVE